MNIYLDFEANGGVFPQEIISIGAVTEDNKSFYSLVRPHFKLDKNIKILTHISQEMAESADSLEDVMSRFDEWLKNCASDYVFIVHGDGDRKFVEVSQSLTENDDTKAILQVIHDNIKRVDKNIAQKFRRKTIKIQSAYLTMKMADAENSLMQGHNALDDAQMLRYVWEHMDSYEFPEDGVTVRVDKPKMTYSKHKSESVFVNDRKFQVPIKACGYSKRQGKKMTWIFPNVRGAVGLVCNSSKVSTRVALMNQILAIAKSGKGEIKGRHFAFATPEEVNASLMG